LKLFTREEKRNKKLVALYEKRVKEGVKPTKAAKLARAEVKN
jgi:hypothetical protein